MPGNRFSLLHLLRWLIISISIGAVIGFGIGLVKDMMEVSLTLGIGMGFILGLVLAFQRYSEK
jgi:hypothetical protein